VYSFRLTMAGSGLTVLVTVVLCVCATTAADDASGTYPVPAALTMDLYHPPCDPDDHWDLLTLYALAEAGRMDPIGLVVDYPLPVDDRGQRPNGAGEPAAVTLAQMRALTGRHIPWVLGAAQPYERVIASLKQGGQVPAGAAFLLDLLRRSPAPVILVITGSCRDVAVAGAVDRELFVRKCRALYLNAGVAFHEGDDAGTEWNVDLDLPAWRAVWDLPCPIFWLPCFERPGEFQVRQYGSWWRFRQGDILPELVPAFQNLLLFALLRQDASRWLTALAAVPDADALRVQQETFRNMWCTAGFFHLAGWAVRKDGTRTERPHSSDVLFDFVPVSVRRNEQGGLFWEPAPQGHTGRFILAVQDTAAYAAGMTTALRTLLKEHLPDRRAAADRPGA